MNVTGSSRNVYLLLRGVATETGVLATLLEKFLCSTRGRQNRIGICGVEIFVTISVTFLKNNSQPF